TKLSWSCVEHDDNHCVIISTIKCDGGNVISWGWFSASGSDNLTGEIQEDNIRQHQRKASDLVSCRQQSEII
uniref:Uncharacterized protein n=1 Tax=Stegastes partitus TaxID=144197 RepID=A0A3B4ZYP0_9TELE